MRHVLPMLMLALLTACQERRTFDDRYNATTNEIEQRASTLDKQASGPAGSANR